MPRDTGGVPLDPLDPLEGGDTEPSAAVSAKVHRVVDETTAPVCSECGATGDDHVLQMIWVVPPFASQLDADVYAIMCVISGPQGPPTWTWCRTKRVFAVAGSFRIVVERPR